MPEKEERNVCAQKEKQGFIHISLLYMPFFFSITLTLTIVFAFVFLRPVAKRCPFLYIKCFSFNARFIVIASPVAVVLVVVGGEVAS